MKDGRHDCRKRDSWQIGTQLIVIEQLELASKMSVHIIAGNYTCHTENAAGKFQGPSGRNCSEKQIIE